MALLPVFAVAVPLVVVGVTGRFVPVLQAGTVLAVVGAVVLFAAGRTTFWTALALGILAVFLWAVGAAVGWLEWERRQRQSV